MLRMNGAIPIHLCTPSWRGQGKLYFLMHFSGIVIFHNMQKIKKKLWDLKLKGTAVTKNLCDESRAKGREEIGDFPTVNVCIAIFRAITPCSLAGV